LLARGDGAKDPLAQCLFLDSLEEVPGELVVDVGFQEDATDLPQPLADHGLGEDPPLPEAGEYAV